MFSFLFHFRSDIGFESHKQEKPGTKSNLVQLLWWDANDK